MSQTERTWAAITALLANNSAGAISATDLRDALASMQGYAELEQNAGLSAIVFADTNYTKFTGFNAAPLQSSDVNTNGLIASHANDNITVQAAGIYAVDFWASVTGDTNGRLLTVAMHVDAVETEPKAEVTTDNQTARLIGFHYLRSFTAGEVLDVRFKIDSAVGSPQETITRACLTMARVG